MYLALGIELGLRARKLAASTLDECDLKKLCLPQHPSLHDSLEKRASFSEVRTIREYMYNCYNGNCQQNSPDTNPLNVNMQIPTVCSIRRSIVVIKSD